MLEDKLADLLGHLDSVRQTGQGKWMARCPAHDDQHPSLSIGLAEGRILLHCFAGCSDRVVLRVIGLDESALFGDGPDTPPHCDSQSGEEVTEDEVLRGSSLHHDYRSEAGDLLYRVVRYDRPGGKQYAVFSPRVGDLWVAGLNRAPKVLYRLPELSRADKSVVVLIPEGEKCVDSLAAVGFTAVCNPFGAGKWEPEYGEWLCGRDVVVLPDNDDPGRRHAAMVEKQLARVARSVRVLELPDLPPKGDVADWFRAGRTPEELKALLACGQKLATTWADLDKEIGPVEWDWPGWLPRGVVVIIGGRSELGKSKLALRIAATYVRGDRWPDGTEYCGPLGSVLWAETEAAQATNLARAKSWGLPLERFQTPHNDPCQDVRLDREEGIAALRARLENGPSIRLVVVDSLSGAHRLDENSGHMVHPLRQLAEVARDFHIVIIVIHHVGKPGKEPRGEVSLEMLRGHSSIGQVPRVAWGVDAPDTRHPHVRRVSCIKNNLAARPAPFWYEHVGDSLRFVDVDVGESTMDELARPAARRFLATVLQRDSMPAQAIISRAEAQGISRATLERAKKELGVASRRAGAQWIWVLPSATVHDRPAERLEEDDDLDDLDHVDHLEDLGA